VADFRGLKLQLLGKSGKSALLRLAMKFFSGPIFYPNSLTYVQCSITAMTETYTITELAREFDVTPRAIRYWEDQGLVAPGRAGQARVFDKRDRTRLKLALRGKRLGLSLAEIKELIDMYDSAGSEATQLQSFLDVLARRRAALEQQRDDIAAVLEEVARFEAQCQQLLEEANKPS
jgi:DNA-binding transcriptional MerR regulator